MSYIDDFRDDLHCEMGQKCENLSFWEGMVWGEQKRKRFEFIEKKEHIGLMSIMKMHLDDMKYT